MTDAAYRVIEDDAQISVINRFGIDGERRAGSERPAGHDASQSPSSVSRTGVWS